MRIWVVMLGLMLTGGIAMAGLRAVNLRCEYHVSPVGVDVLQPRLSWVVEATDPNERGQRQTAFQIIVSSSKEKLDKDIGDLWDTGKVSSDATTVTYAGSPLRSLMECWWKVRVWDKDGNLSEWSEPARWVMGILDTDEWKAEWIGYDEPALWEERLLTFSGCRWIWFPENNPRQSAPIGTRYFRRTFDLPTERKIVRARVLFTADNQFVLFVNGKEVARSDGKEFAWRRPQTAEVTQLLRAGKNALAVAATNEGGPAGVLGKLVVEFESGEPIVVVTDRNWKCSQNEQANWQQEDFDDSGWREARDLGGFGITPWGFVHPQAVYVPPLPFLRKTFTVEKPVKRALLFVSALGTCELRMNGQRVTEDYFVPGWPDFRKRVYYRAYEVTHLIRQGKNAIGAILHDEWYAGYQGGWGQRNKFGGEPRLLVQLHIEFDDGSAQIVVSDESWKANYGPILEADNYMGETDDARRELVGWDTPDYDDSGWKPVITGRGTGDEGRESLKLTWHPGPPIRKVMELPAKSVREIKPGVFVFDLGQNMVGVVRLKVRNAAPGTKIVLRYAEVLEPDGTLHTANLRGARATDTYICKGEPEEVWEPRFTFHGFRYVEVTGYPGTPPLDTVTGIVLHSDVPMVGEFECSHPFVNRLVENIRWGLRGNFFEVPTDCPQRDERQGWTGDAQIFARTATYFADISAFMTKWLIDLNDSQREDGAYPDVAPATGAGFGTPAWGDAGIIVPYTLWRVTGDTQFITHHYDNMRRYIDYLVRNSKDYLRPEIGYGDWVAAGPATPRDVIATAYFAYVVKLMEEMAEAIGRADDANQYRQLFAKIKEAFIKAYVQPDGRIKGDTQTCYALALDIDLLPDELKPKAVEHLVADIENRGWKLATGFVGTRHLMLALSKFGRSDVAYRLLLQEDYPSWLYMVRMGATTIWERWNSIQPDGTIHEPSMNSFNHYAFGCVGEWMFRYVAGIDELEPGFRKILIRPIPDGLEFVRASYNSVRGRIAVEWQKEGDKFQLKVTVPANTTALVCVPTKDASTVTESGKPATQSEGVRFVGVDGNFAVYEVGSGQYEFVSAM
ncbi:MAG: family 78 glycoside hydrolase catalytic domain [Armatimonadota bacterium]|nr:glycoside hydrolase family 78 protein [Armatimonadota bacterium]MDW8142267.1 family 78 glycoside hydrolase catalytic domain [Armatimonadota bacterium]